MALEMGIKQIKILSDSQLVVNQMNGTYQARDLKMTSYLKKASELKELFSELKIEKSREMKIRTQTYLPTLARPFR